MIVESTIQRFIGEEFTLAQYEWGPAEGPRATILRAATEDEYIADCLADPTLPESSRRLMVPTGRADLWWYEVATD